MTARPASHLAALLAVAALAASASAQPMGGPPNALQGFSINRDKPVQITSNTLEVRDKEKRATFIGNVLVAQGDTTMKSNTLDVFYDQDAANARVAQPRPSGQQQIRRLEAKGGVVVTQRDQTATGETGIFDMSSNTVTLIGNVVITQGPQVIRGERLTVDLTTSESRVEGGSKGVQALFNTHRPPKPGDKPADGKAADAADIRDVRTEPRNGKDAAKPKPASGQPMKLN
jgi:lipopolysaccharide export system protein LptA